MDALHGDRPNMLETPARIEPARLERPTAAIVDVIADLTAAAATLERALHPRTAAALADLVRVMNTYYSNLGSVPAGGEMTP